MNKARLLQLAAHLRQEKLPIEWDFDTVMTKCGTAGCALGNCVFLWPDKWNPILQRPWLVDTVFAEAQYWFGISEEQSDALFNSEGYERKCLEFPNQADTLTPLEVAENIEWFVDNHG